MLWATGKTTTRNPLYLPACKTRRKDYRYGTGRILAGATARATATLKVSGVTALSSFKACTWKSLQNPNPGDVVQRHDTTTRALSAELKRSCRPTKLCKNSMKRVHGHVFCSQEQTRPIVQESEIPLSILKVQSTSGARTGSGLDCPSKHNSNRGSPDAHAPIALKEVGLEDP